jgi:DNA-directed RNA polymerase subunit RPC12/RpoP
MEYICSDCGKPAKYRLVPSIEKDVLIELAEEVGYYAFAQQVEREGGDIVRFKWMEKYSCYDCLNILGFWMAERGPSKGYTSIDVDFLDLEVEEAKTKAPPAAAV